MSLKLMFGCLCVALLMIASTGARADNTEDSKGTDTQPEAIYLADNTIFIGDADAACKYLIAGNRAVDAGRAEEAIPHFEAAFKASPLPAAVLGLARCAVLQGDYGSALTRYERVIQDPRTFAHIDILTEYAQTLSQAGQRKNALSVYNRLIELCRPGYTPRELEISLPRFRSDYSENRFNAMLHVIAAMSSRRKSKKSIIEIEQAVSLAPESSMVLFYKGVVLQDTDPQGAEAALKKALRFDDGANTTIINKWLSQAQKQRDALPTSHQ